MPFRAECRWQSGEPLSFSGPERDILEQAAAEVFLPLALLSLRLYNDLVEVSTPVPLNGVDVQYWESLPVRLDLRGRISLQTTGEHLWFDYSGPRPSVGSPHSPARSIPHRAYN